MLTVESLILNIDSVTYIPDIRTSFVINNTADEPIN